MGEINDRDVCDVLDDMCTTKVEYDRDNNRTIYWDEIPFLKVLDLGECVVADVPISGEFAYYTKLEELIFPKNIIETSSYEAFADSYKLKKVVLPETLEKLSYCSFYDIGGNPLHWPI